MGYSCTSSASKTLSRIQELIQEMGYAVIEGGRPVSNSWKVRGKEYFWEVGPERRDGAIVGAVYRLRGRLARPVGKFRISPSGRVVYFSHLPKKVVKALGEERSE